METSEHDRFTEQLTAQTTTYLDHIVDCTVSVQQLLDRYQRGEQYDAVVERIRTLESDCDRANRRLNALITNASVDDIGLLNTRVHLSSSQISELYLTVDEIPNVAERIANELVTIEPRASVACFEGLREMADCAETAVIALEEAIETFVQLLCRPTESGTIVDEIRTIRGTESRSDSIRNDVIATAFDDAAVEQPLVYREFAHLFDALVDAIEDVADHLVLVSSTESWITTEPDHELPS